jgi:hypothetical protein
MDSESLESLKLVFYIGNVVGTVTFGLLKLQKSSWGRFRNNGITLVAYVSVRRAACVVDAAAQRRH